MLNNWRQIVKNACTEIEKRKIHYTELKRAIRKGDSSVNFPGGSENWQCKFSHCNLLSKVDYVNQVSSHNNLQTQETPYLSVPTRPHSKHVLFVVKCTNQVFGFKKGMRINENDILLVIRQSCTKFNLSLSYFS